jgi:hypothetical protein
VPARLFVDSSVWLGFVSARDGRHADADRLIRAALLHKHRLFTSDLVLAEVQRLLLFRAGARAAAAALARLSTSPSLDLLFPDLAIHREAQAYLAKYADQAFTYTDAASFALMKAHRCDAALTFDRHFLVAGFTLWQG